MAPTSESPQQAFDDAIHKLINFSRPTSSEQTDELKALLANVVGLCESEHARWRTLVLALTHKRYHFLSPECRKESKVDDAKNVSAGEGERLIFYTSFSFLFDRAIEQQDKRADEKSALLIAALLALVKIAPHAGGSRDICQLLVEMVQGVVAQTGNIDKAKQAQISLTGRVSLSKLVCQGVCDIEEACKVESSVASTLLGELLQVAADTLDNDFEVIKQTGASNEEREFPSTLHVFVPHRDRGRSKNKKNRQERQPDYLSQRQLVNSITEILLWSRTRKALSVPAFSDTHQRFLKPSSGDTAKQQLTTMQTIIRGLRKTLNSFARDQGFMLSDQFATDASKISHHQINCGKSGDLGGLTRLAKKKSNSKVLQLISLRAVAGKATKFTSVREALVVPDEGDDEVKVVMRDIYVARLKATLAHLRSFVRKTNEKSAVVASMEKSSLCHALAVLVAAAMSDWALTDGEASGLESSRTQAETKLFIGGVKKEMECIDDVVNILNAIAKGTEKNELDVATFMDNDGGVTTKAVMNTIDRHVEEAEVFILVTGADIHLPSDYMQALSDRGCTIHCHDADDIGDRLLREGAQKGDITISLSWNSGDDLDLHVVVPGGEEISYNNRNSKDGLCGLDVDMNAGGAQSLEPVENVFAGDLDRKKQAPLGHYKVVVQNYAYHGTKAGDPVPFSVVVDKNGKKEKFEGSCKGSGSSSDVVVFEFYYAGRTVPFPGDEKDVTAFGTSSMVNITASTGQTLESLSQLVQVVQQHEHIAEIRPLLSEEAAVGNEEEAPRPTARLEVTSQDRTNILLAKLPSRFHVFVGEAFGGGPSLAETCAEDIARRMVAERIAIAELKRNGYPDDIVEAVKAKMATLDVTMEE